MSTTRCAPGLHTPAGLDIGARTPGRHRDRRSSREIVRGGPRTPRSRSRPVLSIAAPAATATDPVCGMAGRRRRRDAAPRRRAASASSSAAAAAATRPAHARERRPGLSWPCSRAKRVTGLVLAAGGSRRLGQPKQLLPLREPTLLDHTRRDGARVRLRPVDRASSAVAAEDVRDGGRPLGRPTWSSTTSFGDGCSSSIAAARGRGRRARRGPGAAAGRPARRDARDGASADRRPRRGGARSVSVRRRPRPPASPSGARPSAGWPGFTATRRCGSSSTAPVTPWPRSRLRAAVPLDVDTWEDYEAVLGSGT